MFNYATGPVEMTEAEVHALGSGPPNSHMADGQALIADTLRTLRQVLRVPDDFDVFMMPGSIRQALDVVISAAIVPTGEAVALSVGYWGDFIADLLRNHVGAQRVTTVTSLEDVGAESVGLVTAVHMETETGQMQPLGELARFRSAGVRTLVDAACTLPTHDLDYDLADIVVLGSHKCLGGPAGLGIVLVRKDMPLIGDWTVEAYRADGVARAAGQSLPTPLVTYPIQVVAALRSAIDRLLDPEAAQRRFAAAQHLRDELSRRGFAVWATEAASSTVTRVDLAAEVDVNAFRSSLAAQGYFVIGNVGASSGGSIRIGTMSDPQVDKGNLDRLLDALEQARAATSPLDLEGAST